MKFGVIFYFLLGLFFFAGEIAAQDASLNKSNWAVLTGIGMLIPTGSYHETNPPCFDCLTEYYKVSPKFSLNNYNFQLQHSHQISSGKKINFSHATTFGFLYLTIKNEKTGRYFGSEANVNFEGKIKNTANELNFMIEDGLNINYEINSRLYFTNTVSLASYISVFHFEKHEELSTSGIHKWSKTSRSLSFIQSLNNTFSLSVTMTERIKCQFQYQVALFSIMSSNYFHRDPNFGPGPYSIRPYPMAIYENKLSYFQINIHYRLVKQ